MLGYEDVGEPKPANRTANGSEKIRYGKKSKRERL
jgi:hypothetical protein